MGKKVSPHSLRIGITRKWDSTWYSKRNFKKNLIEDVTIRRYLTAKLKGSQLAKVEIKRSAAKTEVLLHTAKPGTIIGRSGENIQLLSKELKQKFGGNFDVQVQEIQKPDTNPQLIADNIAFQVEKRFPYRRVCKMAIEKAKEAGAKGIKVQVAGRLNGVDIARSEIYKFGNIPLHTLRANIDYATAEANTTYGVIGIKVWTYYGMVFKDNK